MLYVFYRGLYWSKCGDFFKEIGIWAGEQWGKMMLYDLYVSARRELITRVFGN